MLCCPSLGVEGSLGSLVGCCQGLPAHANDKVFNKRLEVCYGNRLRNQCCRQNLGVDFDASSFILPINPACYTPPTSSSGPPAAIMNVRSSVMLTTLKS